MADFADSSKVTTPNRTDVRPNMLIGEVPVTLITRESPSAPIQVTSHPIEYGNEISDYVIKLPETLILDVVCHDDPVNAGVSRTDLDKSVGARRTWREKRDAILAYKGKLITISTGYAVYTDMVLVDDVLDRRARTSESWTVQLFFQHVNFVQQQWVSVPLSQIPVDKRTDRLKAGARKGSNKEDQGPKPSEDVNEQQVEENKSFLRGLFDDVDASFAGFFQ